jgi:hypothetical protein
MGESYEELHVEGDNSWGKYLIKVKRGVPDNFGRGINPIPDFITQSGLSPSRQSGEPIRR